MLVLSFVPLLVRNLSTSIPNYDNHDRPALIPPASQIDSSWDSSSEHTSAPKEMSKVDHPKLVEVGIGRRIVCVDIVLG